MRLMPFLFLLLLLLLSSCEQPPPSGILPGLEEKYPNLRKRYIYQSMLRLANQNRDPDFENLIRDVHKIVLYTPHSNDSTFQVNTLRPELRNEGFEELVDFRNTNGDRITLWLRDKDDDSQFVAIMDTPADDFIVEIDGQLNLQYLNALRKVDQTTLFNLKDISF